MKFLTTLTFFFVAFIALGQNQQSNGSKISDTEKKRLENNFRALGSFYIDDSGLVVYDNTSQEEKSSESKDKSEKIQDPTPTIKDDIQNETPIVDQRKKNTPPQKNTSENAAPPIIRTKTTNSPNTAFYKKEIIDKEVETTHHEIENTEKIEIEIPRKPNTQVVATKKEDIESSTKDKSVTESKVSKTTQKKGSILNQRRESQYKSMEEAALAVEALLEELKKEEGQITTSGSMSSKLSRGVNKNLRKKFDNANSNSLASQKSSNTSNIDDSNRFGVEPSYFINGVQVEKVEVSKLNKKDIIRREIRVRNTVTGNPNGEVWYEVK